MSFSARYGVNWLDTAKSSSVGSKNQPVANQYKKPTKRGSKFQPETRFKKPTSLKTQLRNKNNKQPVVAVTTKADSLLSEWFDKNTIESLLSRCSLEDIEKQVEWLPLRKPGNNPAGMLRRAIEDGWSAPAGVQHKLKQQTDAKYQAVKLKQIQRQAAAENETVSTRKDSREKLLSQWQSLPVESKNALRQSAIESAKSEAIKRILTRNQDLTDPHWFVLKQLQNQSP